MTEDQVVDISYLKQLEKNVEDLMKSNEELAKRIRELGGEDYEITPHKIIKVLEKVYKIPEGSLEQLIAGGLTERQATALIMHSEGEKIEDISIKITGGSKFTQNAHDALNGAVTKLLNAILLVRTLSLDKNLLQSALNRELAVGSKFDLEPYDHLLE